MDAILLKYTNVNIDRSLIFQTIFQYVHIGDGKWVVRDKRWMLVLLIRFTIGGILGHRVYSAFPTVSLHSLSRWKIEEVWRRLVIRFGPRQIVDSLIPQMCNPGSLVSKDSVRAVSVGNRRLLGGTNWETLFGSLFLYLIFFRLCSNAKF